MKQIEKSQQLVINDFDYTKKSVQENLSDFNLVKQAIPEWVLKIESSLYKVFNEDHVLYLYKKK